MVLCRNNINILVWILVVMIILTATLGLLVSLPEQIKASITAETPFDLHQGQGGVKTGRDYCYFDLAYANVPDTIRENTQRINILDECCHFSVPETDYLSEIKSNITGDSGIKYHMPVLDKVVLIE